MIIAIPASSSTEQRCRPGGRGETRGGHGRTRSAGRGGRTGALGRRPARRRSHRPFRRTRLDLRGGGGTPLPRVRRPDALAAQTVRVGGEGLPLRGRRLPGLPGGVHPRGPGREDLRKAVRAARCGEVGRGGARRGERVRCRAPGAGVSPDGRGGADRDAGRGDSTDELAVGVRRGTKLGTVPRPLPHRAGRHHHRCRGISRPAWPTDLPMPAEPEKRRLFWRKVTDPAWRPPEGR